MVGLHHDGELQHVPSTHGTINFTQYLSIYLSIYLPTYLDLHIHPASHPSI